MTKMAIRRCVHCGMPYNKKLSGHGYGRYSTDEYCPDCSEKVKKAKEETLSKIPVKRELVWAKTLDYSFEELKEIERQRLEEDEKNGLLLRRASMSLMNSEMTQMLIHEVIEIENNLYAYRYWKKINSKKKCSEVEVLIAMEKDSITGEELGIWKNIPSGHGLTYSRRKS